MFQSSRWAFYKKNPGLGKAAAKQRRAQAKCSPAINEPVPIKCSLQGTVLQSTGHYRQPVPSKDLALPAKTLADSGAMDPTFQVISLPALCLPDCSLTPHYRATFVPDTAEHDAGRQESRALQED